MQKIFIVAMAAAILSCNSGEKTSTTETMDSKDMKEGSAKAINTAPYTATYSSSFEMGDPKHAEAVVALWADWDKGDLEPSKKLFADSIHIYLSDGSAIEGPRDSAVAGAQGFRNMFSTVTSTIHAIFPVKSTDKNENWVCVWGTEVSTDKKGKVDSVHLQETWRFNKDGKIDLLYQHGRVATPPKASK